MAVASTSPGLQDPLCARLQNSLSLCAAILKARDHRYIHLHQAVLDLSIWYTILHEYIPYQAFCTGFVPKLHTWKTKHQTLSWLQSLWKILVTNITNVNQSTNQIMKIQTSSQLDCFTAIPCGARLLWPIRWAAGGNGGHLVTDRLPWTWHRLQSSLDRWDTRGC